MKHWIKGRWGILIIIVVWLIFSRHYFIGGLVPFPSAYLTDFFPPWSHYYGHPIKNNAMPDVITQMYPWKQLTIESWKTGQVPRWNPYQFAGNPHLANYQSAVFSPVNLLFFILPFIDAWSIMILLQPLLAGIFTYLFLKSLKITSAGAVIGSVSFMFCGFIVTWMAYGTLGYAVLYPPLLLYGIERFMQKHDVAGAVLIPLALVLSFFSGHFQMSFYVAAAGLAYAVYQIVTEKKEKADKRFIKNIAWVGVLFSLGIVAALPQIIPTINLYSQSVRSALFQKGEVIPWQYIVTMIAPDFFGNPVTRNDWFGHYAEWASFAGVIPFLLAIAAVFLAWRQKYVKFFAVVGAFAILLAFDTPVINFIYWLKLPVLSTSAASRVMVIFSFSVAVLSGFGFDRLKTVWEKQQDKKKLSIIAGIFILIIVFIWLLLLTGNLLFLPNADAEKLTVAKRNFILPCLLLLGGLIVVHAGFRAPKILRRAALLFLLAATVFDLLRFAGKWMPFDLREQVYPEHAGLVYLKKHAGNSRIFGNVYNEALGSRFLPGIEGYDPLYIRRYGEFMLAVQDGTVQTPYRSAVVFPKDGLYSKRALDLLGVRFLLHAKADARNSWAYPYWNYPESFGVPVWSDEQYEIYENTAALPRAFLVYGYDVLSDDQEILRRLFSEDFNIRNRIVLEEKPEINAPEMQRCWDTPPDNVIVDLKTYTPNHITISTDTPCPAMLFLSDNYYPGWNVTVNTFDKPVLRADYTFRAVAVPEGVSDVEFSYENWRY